MLAMAAEALVNTRQWNYYQRSGDLYPEAKEAEGYVHEALALDPGNALAHHMYIHLAEASNPTECIPPFLPPHTRDTPPSVRGPAKSLWPYL